MEEEYDRFIEHLGELWGNYGKIACLNFLTITQGMSLPDANFFLDIFVERL